MQNEGLNHGFFNCFNNRDISFFSIQHFTGIFACAYMVNHGHYFEPFTFPYQPMCSLGIVRCKQAVCNYNCSFHFIKLGAAIKIDFIP